MKCNLVVAGFGKSGTSSLHQYLDLHPDIRMSSEKEPHFFSKSKKRARGEEWYDSLFDGARDETVFGESSTTYSAWEPALVRIKQELSDPKIILLLRDPLERLLSHYRWMVAIGLEKLPLAQALEAEKRSPVSPEIHRRGCYPWYRRGSHYSHFVPLIQMIFGPEKVLLIRTEDLARNPRALLDECFRFLELRPFDIGTTEIHSNETANKLPHGRMAAWPSLPVKKLRLQDWGACWIHS
jgi:hypothetical protein